MTKKELIEENDEIFKLLMEIQDSVELPDDLKRRVAEWIDIYTTGGKVNV